MVQDVTRQAAFKTSRGKHGGKVIDPMVFTGLNLNHDAFDNAHGILLRDQVKSAKFSRMPLSFGPTPSPRQHLNGRFGPRMGDFTYKTHYVTFRTHKNYLNTLLPSTDFTINTQGSWATATFSVSKLGNIEWLGGRGYSFFGLYIHDVVFAKPGHNSSENGEAATMKGDYLPILFENMADPIITGREELNFPKMFATLGEQSTATSSYQLSAGWEGTEFCHINMEDIVEESSAEAVLQTPVLTAKMSTETDDKASNSFVECFSSPALPSLEGEKRWKAGKAEIKFTELQGKELERAFPTLANVVVGLRGVKIVEVLSSGVQARV